VAADLLSTHCWSENSWATRSSQWRKWVGFCEQDDRSIFPASEGDVLAYIGFLKLEGSVSAASLPQYLSAVSRYHELAGVASPTKLCWYALLCGPMIVLLTSVRCLAPHGSALGQQ
jgi:hypothetical protein